MFCTKKGTIKKTSLEKFSRPRSNGINAITINEGDSLLEVKLTNGESHIMIGNRNGRAIRFDESKVRPMGRSAAGVRGMKLDGDEDEIVGMLSLPNESDEVTILAISENGNGKRTIFSEYSVTNRGGKGIKTLQVTDKTGKMVGLKAVNHDEDLMITTKNGIIIRMSMSDISIMGRATQGVRVIKLNNGDQISDVAIVGKQEENQDEEE